MIEDRQNEITNWLREIHGIEMHFSTASLYAKRTMQILIKFVFLVLISSSAIASDEKVIEGKAPEGIEALITDVKSHEGMPKNKGSHGLNEYCYKTDVYVVYSANLLGHGYQLSGSPPKGLECKKSVEVIVSKNKLGMYIGMPKQEVEKLFGVGILKNEQTIIWQSEVFIDGRRFDLQTYIDVQFKEEKLNWLSVFTTTTS